MIQGSKSVIFISFSSLSASKTLREFCFENLLDSETWNRGCMWHSLLRTWAQVSPAIIYSYWGWIKNGIIIGKSCGSVLHMQQLSCQCLLTNLPVPRAVESESIITGLNAVAIKDHYHLPNPPYYLIGSLAERFSPHWICCGAITNLRLQKGQTRPHLTHCLSLLFWWNNFSIC